MKFEREKQQMEEDAEQDLQYAGTGEEASRIRARKDSEIRAIRGQLESIEREYGELRGTLQGRNPNEMFEHIQNLERRLADSDARRASVESRRSGSVRRRSIGSSVHEPPDYMTQIRDLTEQIDQGAQQTAILRGVVDEGFLGVGEEIRGVGAAIHSGNIGGQGPPRPPGPVPRPPGPVPPPPPPPTGPSGGYRSRVPDKSTTNIILKTGQERKFADFIEKKALDQRKTVLKKRRKGKSTLGLLRKRYMDARREANANLRKEKKNLTDLMKKQLSRLKRGQRTAAKKGKQAEIKAKWKLFLQKYPHWKHIKTVAQLRKLTETVKTHRLKL